MGARVVEIVAEIFARCVDRCVDVQKNSLKGVEAQAMLENMTTDSETACTGIMGIGLHTTAQ